MNLLYFLFFGIAPSILWLLFYLREDQHPEPNWLIRKVFLWGMLAVFPALAVELLLKELFQIVLSPAWFFPLYTFIGVALVEEFAKYGVVRWRVVGRPALDEPVDVMLYMMIAALGFAALENVLVLFGLGALSTLPDILTLAALRFVGAVFLHALVSGAFGYFLALSFARQKGGTRYFLVGLAVATSLHGLFNLSILEAREFTHLLVPAGLLAVLAAFNFYGFRKLRKMRSIRTIS